MDLTQDSLLTRALSGVLRSAQEGDLPLFAWTLGLPQAELLDMVHRCFPELGTLAPIHDTDYQHLLDALPADFDELVAMLLAHRPDAPHASETRWLARAIAAACFGERHLWQDLGLFDRADVSALLGRHFPALAGKNVHDLKWKRFLFQELSLRQGTAPRMPPGCQRCEQRQACVQGLS